MSAEMQPKYKEHLTHDWYDQSDDAAVMVVHERRKRMELGEPWWTADYDEFMYKEVGDPGVLRDGLEVVVDDIWYDERPFALYNQKGLAVSVRVASERHIEDPLRYRVFIASLGQTGLSAVWPIESVARDAERYPGFRELTLRDPHDSQAPGPPALVDANSLDPGSVRGLRDLQRQAAEREVRKPKLLRDDRGLHLQVGGEVHDFPFHLKDLARQLESDTSILGSLATTRAVRKPRLSVIRLAATIAE